MHTIDVKMEIRGGMNTTGAKKEFSDADKIACSIDAMLDCGTCEACQ